MLGCKLSLFPRNILTLLPEFPSSFISCFGWKHSQFGYPYVDSYGEVWVAPYITLVSFIITFNRYVWEVNCFDLKYVPLSWTLRIFDILSVQRKATNFNLSNFWTQRRTEQGNIVGMWAVDLSEKIFHINAMISYLVLQKLTAIFRCMTVV